MGKYCYLFPVIKLLLVTYTEIIRLVVLIKSFKNIIFIIGCSVFFFLSILLPNIITFHEMKFSENKTGENFSLIYFITFISQDRQLSKCCFGSF
jgi:hypothetical protein